MRITSANFIRLRDKICQIFISFVCLLAAERVTLKEARKAWSRELKLPNKKEVHQED